MSKVAGTGKRANIALYLFLVVGIAASCYPPDEPLDRPPPPLQGDPTQPECGYDIAPPPTDGYLENPCTDGTTIFTETVENEWVYEDPTEIHTFETSSEGRICIKVLNGDAEGNHTVWWGKVLIDGERVIGRSRLNRGVYEVSETLDLAEGVHELSVTTYGPKDAFISVEIAFSSADEIPQDVQFSLFKTLVVSNLLADPDPIQNSLPVTFYSSLQIRWNRLLLLFEHCTSYSIRYTYQISDAETCTQVRSIQEEMGATPEGSEFYQLPLDWDAKDDNGILVREGDYYYRVVVDIIGHKNGRTILFDRAFSLVRKLTVLELPEAFEVVGPEGGTISIDDPSSSLHEASVIIPPGALDGEYAFTVNLSRQNLGRPTGMIAVGPAMVVDTQASFMKPVEVTLPFSGALIDFFRGESQEVEVWKHGPGGWVRVSGEVLDSEFETVKVETESFSPLQPWVEYPSHLVLDTLVGGGDTEVEEGTIDIAQNVEISYPISISRMGVETVLFTCSSTGINDMSGVLSHGVFFNLMRNTSESDAFGAVAGHSGPLCEHSALCFLYGVEHWYLDPDDPTRAEVFGEIRKNDLTGAHDQHVAGKFEGDPGDGVPAQDAQLGRVRGLGVDGDGNIYFAEVVPSADYSYPYGHRVRKIDISDGKVYTVAGTGVPGFNGEEGSATNLQLHLPRDTAAMEIDGQLLFIADAENRRIRAVNISGWLYPLGDPDKVEQISIPAGHMATVMGGGDIVQDPCTEMPDGVLGRDVRLWQPVGLALANGYLFVSDSCNRVLIMSLDDLRVTTVAGVIGEHGYNGDGRTGISSSLFWPAGLEYDPARSELLIADSRNDRIRRLHYKWRIFLRPDGNDYPDDPEVVPGTSEYPIQTLRRAQELILTAKESENPPPDDDIEIVVSGTDANGNPMPYYGRGYYEFVSVDDLHKDERYENRWTYTMPSHSITIMAEDPEQPPVFDGCDPDGECYSGEYEANCEWCDDHEFFCEQICDGYWKPDCLRCLDCPCDPELRNGNLNRCHCMVVNGIVVARRREGVWFLLASEKGEPSNLRFENIYVRRYQDGIHIKGNSEQPTLWNGRNVVRGCKFEFLGEGSIVDFRRPGWTALSVVNSRNNVFAENEFRDLINREETQIELHGIYFKGYSKYNHVFHNTFANIGGSAVLLRDFCTYNTIEKNLFAKCGDTTAQNGSAYKDWYCSVERCPPEECGYRMRGECPSFYNVFRNNILALDYDGDVVADPHACAVSPQDLPQDAELICCDDFHDTLPACDDYESYVRDDCEQPNDLPDSLEGRVECGDNCHGTQQWQCLELSYSECYDQVHDAWGCDWEK